MIYALPQGTVNSISNSKVMCEHKLTAQHKHTIIGNFL